LLTTITEEVLLNMLIIIIIAELLHILIIIITELLHILIITTEVLHLLITMEWLLNTLIITTTKVELQLLTIITTQEELSQITITGQVKVQSTTTTHTLEPVPLLITMVSQPNNLDLNKNLQDKQLSWEEDSYKNE